MTEKRFGMIKSKISGLYIPIDEQKYYNFSGFEDEYDCMRIVNALNNLYDMKVVNGKIASAYLKENEQLKKENEELKQELKGMEELLKSYRKTIKHNAELLADATSNGYLPPLGDWQVIK